MRIEMINVSKTIRGVQVLDKVSLKMMSGMVYGLEGSNGSGKTMLMRALLGLVRINAGEVLIDGKRLGVDMDFAPNAGALIETAAFIPGKSGRENLLYLAGIRGLVGHEEVDGALREVGLSGAGKKKFRQYSLGMRQRLGIAAAVLERPDLVVLDEPTNALDEQGVEMVEGVVAKQKARGALTVVSCHDAEVLREMVDVVFRLSEGRIVDEEKVC